MTSVALAGLLLFGTGFAAAQENDGTRIERFLERQLSEDGERDVSIIGFRGALSSEATLERLTISDADGVWLEIEDAVLDWNRAAVLRGNIDIERLTASRLEVFRAPLPADDNLPSAEAQAFSLPELPVSIDIGQLAIDEILLDEALIGQPVHVRIDGSARLSGGTGEAAVTLETLGGPNGIFNLNAAYDNATSNLTIDFLLEEEENGIVAELIDLPGRPDLRLAIAGQGPTSDFIADIALQTEGEDRITGQVETILEDGNQQRFLVDVGGDIQPLFLPAYQPFFGNDTRLQAEVQRQADGSTVLNSLSINSAALSLEGNATLGPQGLPNEIALIGHIIPPEGNSVRLPIGGTEADLGAAEIDVAFDRAADEAFSLTVALDRLTVDELAVNAGRLVFDGEIDITESGFEAAVSEIAADLSGISHPDPALASALGERLAFETNLSWIPGAPLILSNLSIQSGDVALTGGASARTGEDRVDLMLDLEATIADLSRFAALASQPLDGAARLSLTGTAEPLSGTFDLAIAGSGTDLRFVEAVPAEIFAGDTVLAANFARSTDGLTLEGLSLSNAELGLTGDASVSSGDTEASVEFELREVGYFTSILSGPVSIDADVARSGTAPFDVALSLTGPNQIAATTTGTFDAESGDFALDVAGSAVGLNVGNGVPPQLLAGRTELSAAATRNGDVLSLTGVSLNNPELSLTGEASVSPTVSRVDVTARLANVGLFTDALSGPANANGTLTRQGDDPWQVDANLSGPGGMSAAVAGRVGLPSNAVDLRINGQAPLALANRYIQPRSIQGTLGFDLAMFGTPGLSALSGSLSSSGARVSVPTYAIAIENVGLNAQISGGQISLTGTGNLSTGGQLNTQGSINIASAGLDGEINLSLVDGRVVDPTLYEARISRADLSISGPLARGPRVSGDITLGETEIRVPEASLAGSAAIPDMRHLGETPEERLTRRFAGLLGRTTGSSAGGSATTALDINISAPGRIFLRGRGIDAEFGGTIRLFGTTANVIPTGQFDLVRGRLSILGTRLDFVEGQANLQGSFDPFLRLAAVSRASGYEITITVEGASSNPNITFSSDPSLPEDEVLAQLLFGRSVSGLSPLQLLQLADAAASLAGGSTNSGFIAGLRDGLGLDDLDLSTDDEGNAAVTAGRYLSENVYTDVTINAEGDADLSLNIDLTPNFTARGSVGSDGSSSIGIFFEQDY